MKRFIVNLGFRGKTLEPKNHQFLGSDFKKNEKILMTILVLKDSNVRVLQHKKGLKSPLQKMAVKDETENLLISSTTYVVNEAKESHIPYPIFRHNYTNHIKILMFNDAGMFKVWKVGVVSQSGRFYFVEQLTYEGSCYRDETGIHSDALESDKLSEDKPAILDTLKAIYNDQPLCPIAMAGPMAVELPDFSEIKPGLAVVEWCDMFSITCLRTNLGSVRAHHSSFCDNKIISLYPGDWVVYKSLGAPEQKPGRETHFELEIKGKACRVNSKPSSAKIKQIIRSL